MFFLIPLSTVLATPYFFKKSTNKIAYFTAISLILSLILAPWQIYSKVLSAKYKSSEIKAFSNQHYPNLCGYGYNLDY